MGMFRRLNPVCHAIPMRMASHASHNIACSRVCLAAVCPVANGSQTISVLFHLQGSAYVYSSSIPGVPSNFNAISSFSSLVWVSTTSIGCSVVTCPSFSIPGNPTRYTNVNVVYCELSPKGNIYGAFVANVKSGSSGPVPSPTAAVPSPSPSSPVVVRSSPPPPRVIVRSPSPPPPSPVASAPPSAMSCLNCDAAAVLASHNNYRAMNSAKPLVWNNTLAAYASLWASKCIWAHSQGPYGENLYASTGSSTVSVGVTDWYNEVRTVGGPHAHGLKFHSVMLLSALHVIVLRLLHLCTFAVEGRNCPDVDGAAHLSRCKRVISHMML